MKQVIIMTLQRLTTVIFLAVSLGCNSQTKRDRQQPQGNENISRTTKLSKEDINKLDSVEIDFQFRGSCYAFSSPVNAKPSNGEAHSSNIAQKVDEAFSHKGLYLSINEKELLRIGSSYLGCKLYFVNTSDSIVTLDAQDSRLDITAEALNEKNEWIPISYLPSSWCGNSYHKITLDKNEYWGFDIPIFKGKIRTKLRYTLSTEKGPKLISNEVVAYLNTGQFDKKKKQGHSPSGIMDPYND